MALGIALLIASAIGMMYGTIKKNKALAISSIILFIMIIAVWIYFYFNPY